MSSICEKNCVLNNDNNSDDILLKQIRTELRELSRSTEAQLLAQSGKIAEMCVYLKTNLSNTLRELVDAMEATGKLDKIIRDVLDTDLNEKIGFVAPTDFGALDNGLFDVTSILSKLIGTYPVIDLMGKTYIITDTLHLKGTKLRGGKLIYKGDSEGDMIHILEGGGLINMELVIETTCPIYSGNIILVDYTGVDEQWIEGDWIIDGLMIRNEHCKEFVEGSTAIRIQYDKYKVITAQKLRNVRFYGRIDYGIYIEPILRDEKDNPVYNTTTFSEVFFYSANCALKVCPLMLSGSLDNAQGGVGLNLSGFANQHIDGINRPFMDLRNTNIVGDMVIPWDYYGDNIPACGVYKMHDSNIMYLRDFMTVATASHEDVSFAFKELSTGERFTNINAVQPKAVEDAAPVRSSGIAWGVDNIKAVVFKPSNDNPYGNEYIGFELQRNNKSVSKNKAVQFGVSTSGTLVWRQYIEGEGWGEIHQIYSQGKIPQSYAGKRPDGLAIGDMKFDTSLKVPVWWNGENWTKADGTIVSS